MKKLKFGKAFTDELEKISTKSSHRRFKETASSSWQESLITGLTNIEATSLLSDWRKLCVAVLFMLVGAVLTLRLFHLQIVEGKNFQERADYNRIQVHFIHAPRGVIYDRNGQILAQNEPGFRLVEASGSGYKSTYVSRDDALKMEVAKDPKFAKLEIDSKRAYPFQEKTAHILGYLGEITEDELKKPEYQNYRIGDKIGRGGVEQIYEKVLQGTNGGEIIEVDAQGKKLRTLRTTEAIPGQNLYLSVDADMQQFAYQQLADAVQKSQSCCGAVIVQDPNSGQVLAMGSYPSYSPTGGLEEALTAANSPILNRAIAGLYPPGSTYKISSALAGLSSGKITAATSYEDTGVLRLGDFSFANWYFTEYGRKESGGVDLVKALQRSNDIYFYQLGRVVGEKWLIDTSRKLGLGKRLGIDIPGEAEGLIPDAGWKKKQIGEVWYPGDTLHMSIGQGFLLTTPLQISHLVSTIAASGDQYPPHLAYKITSPTGKTIKEYRFDSVSVSNYFKASDIGLIKKGLELVPKNGGTAWPFFTFPIQTAGKTGTAEFGDPQNKTHAWYTSYAPVDNPKIAITVLIEAGGEGSSVASPIAREIFRWYFSPDKSNLIKDINAPIATDSARTFGE